MIINDKLNEEVNIFGTRNLLKSAKAIGTVKAFVVGRSCSLTCSQMEHALIVGTSHASLSRRWDPCLRKAWPLTYSALSTTESTFACLATHLVSLIQCRILSGALANVHGEIFLFCHFEGCFLVLTEFHL